MKRAAHTLCPWFLFSALCLWSLTAALQAQELHYVDLTVKEQAAALSITGVPRTLATYDLLRDPNYHFSEAMTTVTLDAPIRQLLLAAQHLAADAAKTPTPDGLPLVDLNIEFILRELSGRQLDHERFNVTTRLMPGPLLEVRSKHAVRTFPMADLTTQSEHQALLQAIFFPKGAVQFNTPRQATFLTDLSYEIADVHLPTWDLEGRNDPAYYLAVLKTNRITIQMGSTWCEREKDGLKMSNSAYLSHYAELIRTYSKALQGGPQGLAALESYVDSLPSDPKALSLLVDRYIQQGELLRAAQLVSGLKPILSHHPGGLENEIYLSKQTTGLRAKLLAAKAQFKRVDGLVSIRSPRPDDLVAGNTWLELEVDRRPEHLLQIECFQNDRRIAGLQRPPYLAAFKADPTQALNELRVVAYFDDRTYSEDRVRVKPMKVDADQEVNLISLRVVVPSGDRFLTDLKAADFRIRERGKKREVVSFIQDHAPLNVAVLFDASVSMNGEKLHRAQYAVKTFLDKLGPEDRAAVYTFDRKVMRLTDGSRDFQGALARLMTITPMLSTSLYDALFVANRELSRRPGRRVIIVISDGNDSSSSVSASDVISLLGSTPVLVYPIIIEREGETGGHDGRVFLEGIAAQSGSIATRVTRFTRFESVFTRIHAELKSFYILGFNSQHRNVSARDLEVTVKRKRGANPRWMRHVEAVYR